MPLTRVRARFVEPLELWDLRVAGRSLFAWQETPFFPQRLAEGLELLRSGLATYEVGGPGTRVAGLDFERVFLTGGRVRGHDFAGALRRAGFAVSVDESPDFPGLAGARALGGADTLCIDLGQTSVKTAWRGETRRHPRDWEALPMAPEDRQALARLRPGVLDFFVRAVRAGVGDAVPSRVVLAFPSQLEDDGTVLGCSYPYPGPDRTLVAELLERTGLDGAEVLLLNDAELAAHSAATRPVGREVRAPLLVLTLGFGVGAARLLPR